MLGWGWGGVFFLFVCLVGFFFEIRFLYVALSNCLGIPRDATASQNLVPVSLLLATRLPGLV